MSVVVVLSTFVVEFTPMIQFCCFSLAHPILYDIALKVFAIKQKSLQTDEYILLLITIHLVIHRDCKHLLHDWHNSYVQEFSLRSFTVQISHPAAVNCTAWWSHNPSNWADVSRRPVRRHECGPPRWQSVWAGAGEDKRRGPTSVDQVETVGSLYLLFPRAEAWLCLGNLGCMGSPAAVSSHGLPLGQSACYSQRPGWCWSSCIPDSEQDRTSLKAHNKGCHLHHLESLSCSAGRYEWFQRKSSTCCPVSKSSYSTRRVGPVWWLASLENCFHLQGCTSSLSGSLQRGWCRG